MRGARPGTRAALLLATLLLALLVVGGSFLDSGGRGGQPASGAARRLPRDRQQPLHYVALGDSTVHGVGASSPEHNYVSRLHARLREIYPNARLTNLGVSGATAADVVRGQLPRAVDLRPQLVTLSIGPNDITGGRDAGQYERDIEAIFRTLTRETAAVLVVNLIPDLAVAPRFRENERAEVGRRAMQFNEALRRQGERYGVELVDLYGPSRQEAPQHPEWVAADGYHPSDAGYERWAELLWQGVRARIED